MSRLRLDPAGLPFIAGALAVGIVAGLVFTPLLAVPFALLAAFFAFFFRDPARAVPASAHDVLSPADGRVLVAGPAEPGVAPPGTWQQISIFLSPMDVHVNRIPVSGRVTRVSFQARPVPARVSRTTPPPPTNAARSGSTTGASGSSRDRSSASWRAAWCAVSRPGRRSRRAIATAS